MEGDFNCEIEDGSQAEVAQALVAWHGEVRRGQTERLVRLREAVAAQGKMNMRSHSKRLVVDHDGAEIEGGEDSSSSDDDDDDDDDDEMMGSEMIMEEEQVRKGPVVDDDGFEMVVGKKGRGRR